MKFKWYGILTILLALAVLVSVAAPALAQSNSPTEATTDQAPIPALGIKAPKMTLVGREVTIAVFQKQTYEPVEDVDLWAIPMSEAELLAPDVTEVTKAITESNVAAEYRLQDARSQALSANRVRIYEPEMVKVGVVKNITSNKNSASDTGVKAVSQNRANVLKPQAVRKEAINNASIPSVQQFDYESLLGTYGMFLGTTDANGELRYTFNEAGWYLLLAVKQGYIPGFSPLIVKDEIKALAIRAPKVTSVGEEITMTVSHMQTNEPIKGAGIWALSLNGVETLKAGLSEIRAEAVIPAQEDNYKLLLEANGIFLGTTGINGELNHTFDETGRYLLVAWKEGYTPAFSFILVKAKIKTLDIMSPGWAPVGTEITMTVFEKHTLDTVEGAGIWALRQEVAEEIKAKLARIAEEGTTAQDYDYKALLENCGIFLGRTDANGQLKHTFDEAGRYFLVTWKEGYAPGFVSLNIKAKIKALDIMSPRWAPVGTEITMTVFEKHTFDRIEDAGIWAIPQEIVEEIKAKLSRIAEEGTTAQDYDYKALLENCGTFLGRTDANGELRHTFGEAGRYFLVTWKKGYSPGFATLGIRAPATD
ncbi:hypothetical protein ACFLTS_04490 [Chloroflexota bacterium]